MKIKYFILISIVISLIFTKIYVANSLYLVSRKIYKNSIQINALKEERNIIKLKIEKLKYKNTIIDPLFNYKIDKNKTKKLNIQNNNNTNSEEKKDNIKTKELFKTINSNNKDL